MGIDCAKSPNSQSQSSVPFNLRSGFRVSAPFNFSRLSFFQTPISKLFLAHEFRLLSDFGFKFSFFLFFKVWLYVPRLKSCEDFNSFKRAIEEFHLRSDYFSEKALTFWAESRTSILNSVTEMGIINEQGKQHTRLSAPV